MVFAPSVKKGYICVPCNFKFKANPLKGALGVRCPYCGKPDKVMEDSLNADALVKEASEY